MPKTVSLTPDLLIAQMLNEGAECGLQLFHIQVSDHAEQVLVACFRNPAGPVHLLAAVHLLCKYWIDVGLASAADFADLLEQEVAAVDLHH